MVPFSTTPALALAAIFFWLTDGPCPASSTGVRLFEIQIEIPGQPDALRMAFAERAPTHLQTSSMAATVGR
jgi:hypothetical protein